MTALNSTPKLVPCVRWKLIEEVSISTREIARGLELGGAERVRQYTAESKTQIKNNLVYLAKSHKSLGLIISALFFILMTTPVTLLAGSEVIGMSSSEITSKIAELSSQPVFQEIYPEIDSNLILSGNGVIASETPISTKSTVSGIWHIVQPGESVSQMAKTFQSNESDIIIFNEIADPKSIQTGMKLMIPGGIVPPKPKPIVSALSVFGARRVSSGQGWLIGSFPRQGGKFPGGYCTSYIQLKKGNIPWYGDAKEWIENARRAGVAIGNTPRVGSIYAEPWLTRAGHVSLVEEVRPDGSFVVTEGNFWQYGGYQKASGRVVLPNAGGSFIYF